MPTAESLRRRFRVGLVVVTALLLSAIGIFMVGQRASLFTRKVDYVIHFASAAGLTTGNAVELVGVTVGNVTQVELSEKPGDSTVTVVVSIERRMTSRIRTDTSATIKTIGLLGDKYIELAGGTEHAAEIAPGGEIAAAPQAGLEKLLAGGEGLLGDLTVIARSLKSILGRTEQGEGLVGQLTSNSPESNRIGETLHETLKQLSVTLQKINEGRGLVGRLVVDEKYGAETAESLRGAIGSAAKTFARLSDAIDSKDSAVGGLLADPEGKKKVFGLIDNLSRAGISLAQVSENLERGSGALPMLLSDRDFGAKFRERLDNLTRHLDSISRKLDEGDGSIGKLINDPSVYDAANDVVVGVNDSKLLRWLIRNRQKRGIEDRYKKEKAKSPDAPGPK